MTDGPKIQVQLLFVFWWIDTPLSFSSCVGVSLHCLFPFWPVFREVAAGAADGGRIEQVSERAPATVIPLAEASAASIHVYIQTVVFPAHTGGETPKTSFPLLPVKS